MLSEQEETAFEAAVTAWENEKLQGPGEHRKTAETYQARFRQLIDDDKFKLSAEDQANLGAGDLLCLAQKRDWQHIRLNNH